ncbi:MAG: hypothetical protein J0L87_12870 [Bacteroidetes bacterium]|nr:hypothetical protein [Bacteroidota bacterium]
MDEKTFHNLSDDELIHGMKLSLENSNKHFKAAISIEKEELYGIANSHLILSSEEGIKALLFLTKFLKIELENIDISPFFKKHAPKHKVAKEVYWEFKYYNQIMDSVLKELASKKDKYITFKNGIPSLDNEKLKQDYVRGLALNKRQLLVSHIRNNWEVEEQEQKWWNKADYYKNRGFYVNFYNRKWESPDDITKEIYFESKKIVTTIVEFMNACCTRQDLNDIQETLPSLQMPTIELHSKILPSGHKLDHIIITEIPNADGSDIDYKIEYVDWTDIDKKRIHVGTCCLTLGSISFEKSEPVGIPVGAIKLACEWVEQRMGEERV